MNKATTVENPLGYERVGRLLARYAIPSIIALIINSLYNMVDQIFIGQGVIFLGGGRVFFDVSMTVGFCRYGVCFMAATSFSRRFQQ